MVAIVWGAASCAQPADTAVADFKKWDERTEFELCEAAALWFDAEPRLPMWWRARRKFRLWRPMISSGDIPTLPAPVRHTKGGAHRTISSVTPQTRVHREVLKALAAKRRVGRHCF